MFSGRFLCHFIVFFMIAFPCSVSAGWLFGDGNDRDKSGLDNESGYDINTVVTVNGRISEIKTDESSDPHGPARIVIQADEESITLILGPKSFWQEKGIPVKKDDEITARGSKAQGQNGKIYIFVQSLSDYSSETSIIIRNNNGKPVWSGSGGTGYDLHRTAPARRFRGGRNH